MSAHSAPTIRHFEADSMRLIEAGYQGKPFVLMIWSLDCVYCKASMKLLSDEGRRRGFEVVTVATDSVGDARSVRQIRARLGEVRLQGPAWAFGAAPPEQLRYTIDPAWYGEVPRSYWYDGRGGRVAHSGSITAETLARMLPAR